MGDVVDDGDFDLACVGAGEAALEELDVALLLDSGAGDGVAEEGEFAFEGQGFAGGFG